ncbi:MAG: Ig-like domain-containing protein, partial [Cyclobacteriaceae bacterium]|nr:Ig-like domain-containing protein [Cyclobacteriaceae bacterium]
FTFETISIRVTEYPTYGRVFSLSDFLVKYTPSKAFFEDAPHEGERKDQFGISIFKDGKIIATQTITVRMDDFPCSLYAVEDKIATTRETAVSFLVTWNDRLCDIRSDNIEYSIALAPQHGRAELNGSTFTYTPDAGYQGEDEFVYQLKAFRQENMVSVGPLISYGLVTIDVGE